MAGVNVPNKLSTHTQGPQHTSRAPTVPLTERAGHVVMTHRTEMHVAPVESLQAQQGQAGAMRTGERLDITTNDVLCLEPKDHKINRGGCSIL
uniref:Uncharacterized protein n=1 Tax=Tetradesmus obliquus TaxID=3088 RepID=A0A383VFV4_TETOB|eukprot:jgi/Sobl393_1/17795/SZX64071.1